MLKLYQVSFSDPNGPDKFGNYWAENAENAIDEFINDNDINGDDIKENPNNFAIFPENKAVNVADILDLLDRYIIKPLKRQ